MSAAVFISTSADDAHADHLVSALNARGAHAFRFHPNDYPSQGNSISIWVSKSGGPAFEIINPHHRIRSHDVIGAWYRRPRRPGPQKITTDLDNYISRQSILAVESVYHILESRWLASPTRLQVAEDKVEQLRRAIEVGLSVPRTVISNSPSVLRDFRREVRGRIAVKPIQVQGVFADAEFRFPLTVGVEPADSVPGGVEIAPTVYQEYVPKLRELRCIVIGERVLAAELDTQALPGARDDARGAPESARSRPHELPSGVQAKLVALTKAFGLHFCSADLILTPGGEYFFLDLNPNGQWLWIELETGLPITETLIDYWLIEHTSDDLGVP